MLPSLAMQVRIPLCCTLVYFAAVHLLPSLVAQLKVIVQYDRCREEYLRRVDGWVIKALLQTADRPPHRDTK